MLESVIHTDEQPEVTSAILPIRSLAFSVDDVPEAPSDPSVPSERGESPRDLTDLGGSEVYESGRDSFPPASSSPGKDQDLTTRSLHHTLASHRIELQGYLEDWSRRQNQILNSALSAREQTIDASSFGKREHGLPRDVPVLVQENGLGRSGTGSHSGTVQHLAPCCMPNNVHASAAVHKMGMDSGEPVYGDEIMDTRSYNSHGKSWSSHYANHTNSNHRLSDTARSKASSRLTQLNHFWKSGKTNIITAIGESTRFHLEGKSGSRCERCVHRCMHPNFKYRNWFHIFICFFEWADVKYRCGQDLVNDKANQGRLTRLTLSTGFEGLCAVIILANSICLGYSSDYAIHNLEAPSTDTLDALELAFTAFYTTELLLRFLVLGWAFIFTDDWKWNAFDILLVASALWDVISARLGSNSGGNTSVLRIMRLTKMMKLLRMFRILRMFRELRLILNSIIGSMRSMIWSVLLILLITYVIGIVFLQAGTATLMDGTSESTRDGIQTHWGSLLDSMLSLYIASTGGIDWIEVASTLKPVGQMYYYLFLLYIAFFLFVVMNTLTSLFVETAMKNAEQDHHMVIQDEMKRKNEYINKITKLYQKIAKSPKAELTKADFDKVLCDSEMLAFMQSLEIDSMDVEQFFSILSCDGTQVVDIETFVVGCMKLRGMARSMDLLGLIHAQQRDAARIRQIENQVSSVKELMKSFQHSAGLWRTEARMQQFCRNESSSRSRSPSVEEASKPHPPTNTRHARFKSH